MTENPYEFGYSFHRNNQHNAWNEGYNAAIDDILTRYITFSNPDFKAIEALRKEAE